MTTCPSSPAAMHLPADEQPAADARAQREQQRVARPARRAVTVLGQQRDVRVVVGPHRQAEALGHHVAKRHAAQRQVHRAVDDAGRRIDERGNAEADPRDGELGCVEHLADRSDDRLEDLRLVGATGAPLGAMVDVQVLIDHSRQELGAAQVDADHTAGGHGAATIHRWQ